MSDTNTPTPGGTSDPARYPDPSPVRAWWGRHKVQVLALAVSLASALLGSVLTWLGVPPKTVERVQEVIVTVPIPVLDEIDGAGGPVPPSFGWSPDPEAVAAYRQGLPDPWFGDTPAGRALMDDPGDVYHWQYARDVLGAVLPARNQGSVGSCVSFAIAGAADHLQLAQVAAERRAGAARTEFRPCVQEAIYALSRVEVGGGRITGDGSLVSWGGEAGRRYGLLPRGVVGRHDLTAYSEERCRAWGRTGLPDDLEPEAKRHPVRGVAFVRSADEAKKALAQRYPLAIGSMLGVSRQRDASGRARWTTSWAHAMCVLGHTKQNGGMFFFWNSWGKDYHVGPKGPGDPPDGGFWLAEADMDRLLRMRDTECIALSDAVGFPARRLDWNIRAEPAGLLANRAQEHVARGPKQLFALKW